MEMTQDIEKSTKELTKFYNQLFSWLEHYEMMAKTAIRKRWSCPITICI